MLFCSLHCLNHGVICNVVFTHTNLRNAIFLWGILKYSLFDKHPPNNNTWDIFSLKFCVGVNWDRFYMTSKLAPNSEVGRLLKQYGFSKTVQKSGLWYAWYLDDVVIAMATHVKAVYFGGHLDCGQPRDLVLQSLYNAHSCLLISRLPAHRDTWWTRLTSPNTNRPHTCILNMVVIRDT